MAHSGHSGRGNKDLHPSKEKQLNEIKRKSRSIPGFLTRYILNPRTVFDGDRLKRVAFGERDSRKIHKTILLVGETGAGKSTVINAMVTFMLGVCSEDRIWCEITEAKKTQTHCQPSAVTVYDVFTEHCPFSLTVIDTPGYGKTEGTKGNFKIVESLHELFSSEDGVHEIDAVCLVMTSNTTRLAEHQLDVCKAVLSLFGSDMEKNFVLFFTHAPRKPNNAIKAIEEAKIPCAQTDKGEPVYFRFDNCHCENFNDEDIFADYQESSKLLNTTMGSFLAFLEKSKTISVKMTVAVLRSHKQLTACISNIKEKITLTELHQKELEQTKQGLQKHEGEKGDINNFEFTVEEPYKVKVPIEHNWWQFRRKEATCCSVCEENCHYPGCWWAKDLSWCSVMSDGKCMVCTGRCHYTKHVKEGKIYEVKTRKVRKTMKDLKTKYEKDSGETKSMVRRLENEIKGQEKEKIKLVEECFQCVIKLEEIALKSDSVYTLQYLDFLIEKLRETGNADQVQKLEEIKKKV